MKWFRHSLRFVIAGSSLAGFLGGWALLGHAPKPEPLAGSSGAANSSLEPLPTLAPLPSLDDNLGQIRRLPSLPASGFSSGPRFRTGGS